MLQRDHAQAIAWAEKAVALAEQFNALDTLVSAYNAMGSSLIVSGDEERGYEYLEKSLALALDGGQEHEVVVAYANLGSACGEVYRFELATATSPRHRIYHRARRDHGRPHDVMVASRILPRALECRGGDGPGRADRWGVFPSATSRPWLRWLDCARGAAILEPWRRWTRRRSP
jgi:tetratricopeptide (TPR) repeat protein